MRPPPETDDANAASHPSGRRVALVALLSLFASGLARAAALAALAARPSVAIDRSDGLAFIVGIAAAAPVGIATLLLGLRLGGHRPARVLALHAPDARAFARWIVALALLELTLEGLLRALQRPRVPPEWVTAYRTAGSPTLLFIALVLVAPAFEELFFRGLVQPALARTRLGAAGSIALTAALFTVAHGPTDVTTALGAASAGLLLSLARHQSGSTLTALSLHALGNAKTFVAIAIAARA